MRNKTIAKSDVTVCLILYAVCICFLGLQALRLNTPPVVDEIGTLANTAHMTGYDWSECIVSMQRRGDDAVGYYKIGIALLYYPAFLLLKNPFWVYKVCIFINMALISLISVFAYKIIKRHLLPAANITNHTFITDTLIPALIALAVALLPSVNLQSMYAKSEPLLILLPWPIVYCMLESMYAENVEPASRGIIYPVAAAFFSVYAYMAHTRGLVLIIALFLTNLIIHVARKRPLFKWVPYIVSTAVFLVIERVLSQYFRQKVYLYGTQNTSMANAGLGALKNLFTVQGLTAFGRLIAGWLYNVMVSSYGMIIIGLLISICLFFRVFRLRRKAEPGNESFDAGCRKMTVLSVFALLNFCGSFAMGALFFFRPIYAFFTGESMVRADRLLYGRYTLCGVGMLVLIALFYLIYRKDVMKLRTRIAAAAVYVIVFVLFLTQVSPFIDGHTANARYFISLCTFMKYPYPGETTQVIENMCEALRQAGLLAFAVFIFLLIMTSDLTKKRRQTLANVLSCTATGCAIVYCMAITAVNFVNARQARDSFIMGRVYEPAKFLNDIAEHTEVEKKYPYVLTDYANIGVKHFQPAAFAYRFGSKQTKLAGMDNIFIVSRSGGFLEDYFDDDYYLFDDFDYDRGYGNIVYVKGDKLASELESAGYHMTEYTGQLIKAEE